MSASKLPSFAVNLPAFVDIYAPGPWVSPFSALLPAAFKPPAWLAKVPPRFHGNPRHIQTATEWLGGPYRFPTNITASTFMESPLETFQDPRFSRKYLVVHGPHRSGKTTLVANVLYWRYYQSLHYHPDLSLIYFDAGRLSRMLDVYDKFDDIERVCRKFLAPQETVDGLASVFEDILEPSFLLVIDEFNLSTIQRYGNKLGQGNGRQLLGELVMKRLENNAPVWVITNETPDTLQPKFPRLHARMIDEREFALYACEPLERIPL